MRNGDGQTAAHVGIRTLFVTSAAFAQFTRKHPGSSAGSERRGRRYLEIRETIEKVQG